MPLVLKGVMQAPVTPLREDFSLDLTTLEKAADFGRQGGGGGWSRRKRRQETWGVRRGIETSAGLVGEGL